MEGTEGTEGMSEILNAIENVEAVGEDILRSKQSIIDLNVKLNRNREAINALKRHENYANDSNKLWICFGNSFIKTRVSSAKSLINRDQNELNKQINDLRTGLKTKVDQLRQLEGKDVLKGFDLKPLERHELSALDTLL